MQLSVDIKYDLNIIGDETKMAAIDTHELSTCRYLTYLFHSNILNIHLHFPYLHSTWSESFPLRIYSEYVE